MKQSEFSALERAMREQMQDSAHDCEHVYRVLYTALEIARTEPNVDLDLLTAACLLHDIGRREQFENPKLRHEEVGAEKAQRILAGLHYDGDFIRRVCACILTHRYRTDRKPGCIEAKILFDADKIDVCGAIGIARTLFYNGEMREALYSLDENGQVSDGRGDTVPSFFHEYRYKLEGIYGRFYTQEGARIAAERRDAASSFYRSMLSEVRGAYAGKALLGDVLEDGK